LGGRAQPAIPEKAHNALVEELDRLGRSLAQRWAVLRDHGKCRGALAQKVMARVITAARAIVTRRKLTSSMGAAFGGTLVLLVP
jgi:hypothetical protein